MSSTADAIRPKLAAMVEREERRTGSRMLAYDVVASLTGRSPSWIRKLLGRQPGIGLAHDVALNISAAYQRLCMTVEATTAKQEGKLEKDLAAFTGNCGPDDYLARAIGAGVAAALAVLTEGKE